PLDDLFATLRGDRLVAIWAMSLTDARIEHAQIVVHLGDGPDRGPRVLPRGLLRNRNRGTEPRDVFDIGFGHLAKELPRKAGEAFHIAPLSLGKQGIECQRTLAGPTDA